ncbi:MAG: hypothetical protein Q8J69_12445 [Sphingobacteriaceae bacterium]|nr:hypothetical protein [Sphingobacteriaceae bacterium]
MEDQKKLDKVLRAKLKDFEMAPPPMLFDQIIKQVNPPVQKLVPVWYRRPQMQRIAASFTILAVAATVVLSELRESAAPATRSNLAQFDTLASDRRDNRLQDLELRAEQLASEQKQEIKDLVQPQAVTARLVSVEAQTAQPNNTRETIEEMNLRQLQPLKSRTAQMPLMAKAPAIVQESPQYAEGPSGVIPALIKSYGVLSNADLFAIAKEKFQDFKTKEHYVSFNLGSLEIGQTIQLSKPENLDEN